MAAVDQDRQAHGPRPAVVGQLVERGPHGAAGIEDVVAEHHHLVFDLEGRWLPLTTGRGADRRQVVAVEGDVERADGELLALHPLDLLGQPLGQRQAAGADADQAQVADIRMALEQLAGHAPQDPFHFARVEHTALLVQADILGLSHFRLRWRDGMARFRALSTTRRCD